LQQARDRALASAFPTAPILPLFLCRTLSSRFHAPEIDGKVYINDFGALENLQAGRFYRAEITEAHDYDLVARIVSSES
jgi:hypothetical protein